MALNVQQPNYLEEGIDKGFPNGEQVEEKAKKTAETLKNKPKKNEKFIDRMKRILGFSENAKEGDVKKTSKTKNLDEEQPKVGPEGAPEEKKLSEESPEVTE